MNADSILAMFENIDEPTKQILGKKLKPQLLKAILDVNKKMKTANQNANTLLPPPRMILAAFRYCPWDKVRVVIIGQDPFINPGEAMGLCFSVPRTVKKIPPSTKNIYKCLKQCGQINDENVGHGDLSVWASQGVLMINAALTTILKKSNSHAEEWKEYTDAIITELSFGEKPLIFILLGEFAQKKGELIDKKHTILQWGHPSTMNSANVDTNPKSFKYCDVFTRTNEILTSRGDTPIVWNPNHVIGAVDNHDLVEVIDETAVPVLGIHQAMDKLNEIILTSHQWKTPRDKGEDDPMPLTDKNHLWIFTDGGARANGKPTCVASWGFYITNGIHTLSEYDIVAPIDIPGKVYKSSNNRGELTAILRGLEYVASVFIKNDDNVFNCKHVTIVSDSKISIEGVDVKSIDGKANTDLLVPAKELLRILRSQYTITFQHIHSHEVCEAAPLSTEEFLWKGNYIVDKLCQIPLPAVPKPNGRGKK